MSIRAYAAIPVKRHDKIAIVDKVTPSGKRQVEGNNMAPVEQQIEIMITSADHFFVD